MSAIDLSAARATDDGTALAGSDALADLLLEASAALRQGAADRSGPLPGGGPDRVARDMRAALAAGRSGVLAPTGIGAASALTALTTALAAGSADPVDPACAGHLHCPPLAVAVAADMVAGALNQSLDSWDQAPAATAVEESVVATLADLVGYAPAEADGVVTTGGTESNLMGLLLAREHAGIRGSTDRPRIFCSRRAHFTVARAAALLGFGPDAVVEVPVDARHRMDVAALDAELSRAERAGEVPVAVVATAGTTDAGSIDPLAESIGIARRYGAWAHVDAAYGGGALFSSRLAPLLDGIDGADSVGLDLHKLGWQPVPAGVFLAGRRAAFAPLDRSVHYLNPRDDAVAGYPSRLGMSLRTTRRADAFKIAVTLRALGHDGLGALVDRCHDLTTYAAERIAAHPRLRLATAPVLTTVVFGYDPALNAALRRRLLAEGTAVVGRTDLDGTTWLKLTLLNPHATVTDVERVLDAVAEAGDAERHAEGHPG